MTGAQPDPTDFEAMYAANPDPWRFTTSWYEQRRFALIAAMLPRQHYRRILEPACANGMLTSALVRRAGEVVAFDSVATAVDQARQRLAGTGARVECRDVRDPWPGEEDGYDLIVLSELLYYLPAEVSVGLVGRALAALAGDGHLVTCQWRHPVAGTPQRGDDISTHLAGREDARVLAHYVDPDCVIDVVGHRAAPTVAELEDLTGR